MKISNDDIKKSYEDLQLVLEPLKQKIKEFEKQCHLQKTELGKPFSEKLEQYYDERFLDRNNTPIREGTRFKDEEGRIYLCKKRGMQIIFGTLLFNNRISCLKYKKDMTPLKKTVDFGESQTKYFEVIIEI